MSNQNPQCEASCSNPAHSRVTWGYRKVQTAHLCKEHIETCWAMIHGLVNLGLAIWIQLPPQKKEFVVNIDVAFPSKWVRAADLKGCDVTVTIARCLEEEVAREGSTQPVLYFHGAEKGLVLNKTNANTIADGLGQETDNWVGAQITLYPTKTDFQGKRVDCIRVRELSNVSPPEPAPETVPAPDADALAPATVPASAPLADSEIPF